MRFIYKSSGGSATPKDRENFSVGLSESGGGVLIALKSMLALRSAGMGFYQSKEAFVIWPLAYKRWN